MRSKTLITEFNREAKELRRLRSGLVKLSGDEWDEEYMKLVDHHIGYLHVVTDAGMDELGPVNPAESLGSLIKWKLCDPNFGKRPDWNFLADSPELRSAWNRQRAERQLGYMHRLWSSRKHQQESGLDASVGDMMRQCKGGQLRLEMVRNALDRERECFDFSAAFPHKKLKRGAIFRDGLMFEEAVRRNARRRQKGYTGRLTTRAAAEYAAKRLYAVALKMSHRSMCELFVRYGAEGVMFYHDAHRSRHSRLARALVACVAVADFSGPRPFCDVGRAYGVLNLLKL